MGLGSSVAGAGPTILCTNIAAVRAGLNMSRDTGSFVASLATLTGAATVLCAGTLGDLYGKKRMYVYGLLSAITFALMAAAAPHGAVLMTARAGSGVAYAFLVGLSLAIVNETFPPERRNRAIALFLAACFVITAPLPAVGTWLAEHVGWRYSFLVAPTVAAISLVATIRYVPETARAHRRLDRVGVLLIAAALLGVVYGISHLQNGFTASSIGPIVVGLGAGAGFVFHELRTPEPVLDLRIFSSKRFNVAVIAGVTSSFVSGGSIVLFAFYLVTVRGHSPELLSLLLIPAMGLQALAATWAERASNRFGDRIVLVSGLFMLCVGLLISSLLDEHSMPRVLLAALTSIAIGGAIIGTPQSTIMMSSAPTELGGAVSAVKAALSEAGYSLGPALFPAIGTWAFVQERNRRLDEMNVTLGEAREAFRIAHGGTPAPDSSQQVLDPEFARQVVQGAEQCMLYAIHTVSLIMAAVPILAIVAALILLPRKSTAR
ncbi:MAG: MFS transporter [Mycobacteriaceae bacterium]|nr:MFS transporter [Mycobacteriaceae bacterium]